MEVLAGAHLDHIKQRAAEDDGVAAAAAALAPAGPEQRRDPSGQEHEPHRAGGHQVVIPELARVTCRVSRRVVGHIAGNFNVITECSRIIFTPNSEFTISPLSNIICTPHVVLHPQPELVEVEEEEGDGDEE